MIILAALAILLLLISSYLYSDTITEREALYLTTTMDDARGWNIYTLNGDEPTPLDASEVRSYAGTVYLERVIEADWFTSGYSRVKLSAKRWTSVFVDGALVYTNCPTASNTLPVAFPKEDEEVDLTANHGFTIDASWVGQTLTLATALRGDASGTLVFVLTSDDVEEALNAAWTNKRSIPATLFAVIGFLLLALFAYSLIQRQTDFGLLALSAAALMQMFAMMSLLEKNTFDTWLRPLFSQFYSILPMLYLALRMKRNRRIYLALLLFCWGISFAVTSINYFLPMPIWLQDFVLYLTFFPMTALFLISIREKRDGNPAFRSLMPGFYITLIAIGILLLLSLLVYAVAPEYTGLLSLVRYAFYVVFDGIPIFLLQGFSTSLLVLILITAALQQIRHSVKAAEDAKLLMLKNDLILDNLQTLERSSQALAVARHDELFHLRTLSELYRESPEQAETYAASLTDELCNIPPVGRYTENRIVNTILTVQAGKANAHDVRFWVEAIVPENLPIPDKDLCAVLMNLLDNAVTAASHAVHDDMRKVSVRLYTEDGYLLIVIENTLPKDFNPDIFRQTLGTKAKLDTDRHGFGLMSVRATLSHYGGEPRFCLEGGALVARAAMRVGG